MSVGRINLEGVTRTRHEVIEYAMALEVQGFSEVRIVELGEVALDPTGVGVGPKKMKKDSSFSVLK